MKKILTIITALCLLLSIVMLTGCGGTGASVTDEHVQMVKNAVKDEYPGTTYGKAFDEFFANPSWRYFISDEGEKCVEFKGKCTYQDVEVEALIQFLIAEDEETFKLEYVAFNDVPQNKLISAALLEKVFEEAVPSETLVPKTTPTPQAATEYPDEDITAGSAKADTYSEPAPKTENTFRKVESGLDAIELVEQFNANTGIDFIRYDVSADSNSEFWLVYGMIDVGDGELGIGSAYKVYVDTSEVVQGPSEGPLDEW